MFGDLLIALGDKLLLFVELFLDPGYLRPELVGDYVPVGHRYAEQYPYRQGEEDRDQRNHMVAKVRHV